MNKWSSPAVGMVMFWVCNALAQTPSVPPLINYQGRLTDAAGAGISGTRNLTFNIYSNAVGASTAIWGPQCFSDVPLVDGHFNVILGTTDTVGRVILDAWGSKDRYLGIKINAGDEIVPRQQVLSTAYAFNGVPAGTVNAFAGPTNNIPKGWLPCDGRAVSRGTYSALFAAVGTYWGTGNGSTTFNLPDLRGQFLRGTDLGSGVDPNVGSRTPEGTGTAEDAGSVQGDATKLPIVTIGDAGAHQHVTVVHGAARQNHFGTRSLGANPGAYSGAGLNDTTSSGPRTSSDGDHVHTITGGDAETRPKNAYVNWIIKF